MDSAGAVAVASRLGIATEAYETARNHWPREGRHILGCFDDETVVVYQAFNRECVPLPPSRSTAVAVDVVGLHVQDWRVCGGAQQVHGRARLRAADDLGEDEFPVDDVQVRVST